MAETATERKRPAETILRQRGRGMAVSGCVAKDGALYRVRQPGPVDAEPVFHEVTRDSSSGRVVCSCDTFLEFGVYAAFRCEHIFAVVHFVHAHQAEAAEAAERAAAGYVFPRDPEARTFADLVGTTQLRLIRETARAAGVDEDAECARLLRCKTEDLSKQAAAAFIDYLTDLAKELHG